MHLYLDTPVQNYFNVFISTNPRHYGTYGTFATIAYDESECATVRSGCKTNALSLSPDMRTAGTAVGVFFWPPFARWMIDIFSWRGALLIMAAAQLHGVVFGALLRPRPEVTSPAPEVADARRKKTAQVKTGLDALPHLSCRSLGATADFKTKKRDASEFSSSISGASWKVQSESNSSGDVVKSLTASQTDNCASKYTFCGTKHERDTCQGCSKDLSDKTHVSGEFTTVHTLELGVAASPGPPSALCTFAPWVLFFLGNWLIQSCHVLITVLTPVRAHHLGVEPHLAALLMSIYGVSSGVFRSVSFGAC